MPSLTKRTTALLAAAALTLTASATAATAVNRSSNDTAAKASAAAAAPQASSGLGVAAKKDPIGGPKKGAALWNQKGITKQLKNSGVSWYYNWAPTPNGVKAPKGVDFVPMIWGKDSVTKANLAAAKKHGKQSNTLLGFNEPDLAEQSNMTPQQALDLWPQLQKTGMRLGSPAVAWGADQNGQWLDRFMKVSAKHTRNWSFILIMW